MASILTSTLRKALMSAAGGGEEAAMRSTGLGLRGALATRVAPALVGGAGLAAAADYANAEDDIPVDETRKRVADLQNDLDIFDHGSATEVQETLQRKGFPVRIDGKIGPETAAAISQYRKETVEQLAQANARLAEVEHQAAYKATSVSPEHEMMRELGPWAGAAGGLALGYASRSGAVKSAAKKLIEKNAFINDLLTEGAVRGGKSARGAVEPATRAANINEFWREGGAGARVPFEVNTAGGFKPRSKAATPSELFPQPSKMFRTSDIGFIGGGLGEAGLSGGGLIAANQELKDAQAKADADPTEANLARLERAKDMVKLAEGFMRLGLGVAAARGVAAVKMPYSLARPNIAGAEAERALLLDYFKRSRTRAGSKR